MIATLHRAGDSWVGANPGATDLLVSVVACPENTRVECKGHNGCDGALCRSNVRMMIRSARSLGVNGDGVG